jgi:aconitate hydratase
LKNLLVKRLGGWTRLLPDSVEMSIHEASEEYQAREEQIVVFAGKMYGAGSARDWAAKGTRLLGVRAIFAESFERIHRANLVRMGILPLKFEDGVTIDSLRLGNQTQVTIEQTVEELQPFSQITANISDNSGIAKKIKVTALIETIDEKKYLFAGGILPFVTENILR